MTKSSNRVLLGSFVMRGVVGLVVIFPCLVVKIEYLVVNLIDLVVKITSLVVLVKLWNAI